MSAAVFLVVVFKVDIVQQKAKTRCFRDIQLCQQSRERYMRTRRSIEQSGGRRRGQKETQQPYPVVLKGHFHEFLITVPAGHGNGHACGIDNGVGSAHATLKGQASGHVVTTLHTDHFSDLVEHKALASDLHAHPFDAVNLVRRE